jgi:hypothetical protein
MTFADHAPSIAVPVEVSLVRGGPFYRAQQALRLIRDENRYATAEIPTIRRAYIFGKRVVQQV